MTHLFVSPPQLSDARTDVTVVDVRDAWAYEDGHVPGAVNIPFDDFRDPTDETPGKLPTADEFATLLSEHGIGTDDRVIAYDDEFGVYASRLLVTMELFGHDIDRLGLLDGDYTAWRHQYDTTTETLEISTREYECTRTDNDPLISASELDADLDGDAVVVDTRDRIEYDAVHVAGAVNFQWRALVDESHRGLKSERRCREVLADHGITFDRPVRLYCNTARRLSFVYAVLRELGHEDVAFYEGGIDAWAEYGGAVETT